MSSRFKFPAAGLMSALVVCWGCAYEKPAVSTSAEEAVVRGTVTVHGQPRKQGTITFDPGNIHRKDSLPRSAEIGEDGAYELKTLVGENSVTVRSPEIDKDTKLSANQRTVVVKPGENKVPVNLP